MPDPQILSVEGVEVEIRAWYGTDNALRATLEKTNGDPLNLSNYDVTMTIFDRPGGTVRFVQTNTPGSHEDATAGKTIFTVGATTFAVLVARRSWTWKYLVVSRERTTNQRHIHFYGDFRVNMPAGAIVTSVMSLSVSDGVTTSSGTATV